MARRSFDWNDSFSTGEPSIDLQHRYLIKTVNELGLAIDQGRGEAVIQEILATTEFYIVWHFGREEDCMERYKCPMAGRNKQAHAFFIEKFKGLRMEIENEGASIELAERVYAELADWLSDHILKVDSALASVVPHQPAGPG
jgi:hemerythrin